VRSGLSGPMAIGHATSPDGIAWTKDPRNPVLRPSGHRRDFNGLQVAEPGAVVVRDKVYLYFAAVGMRESGNPLQLQPGRWEIDGDLGGQGAAVWQRVDHESRRHPSATRDRKRRSGE
jgi:hypothetical protein